MFYYIEGKLALLEPGFAVIDAGGVGYKLTISSNTHDTMPPHLSVKEAPTVRLYTHLAIREDDIELFGFGSNEELAAFKMLIGVSGVGPKAAISILSTLTPEKLALAVSSGDTKAISKANGIGAKTAARVVLELQDKLLKTVGKDTLPTSVSSAGTPAIGGGKLAEAQDALMVLGYSRAEALDALRAVDPSLELEDLIRAALKRLMRNF